jgi:hypothetical protein
MDDHDYLSTACFHELHDACREVCTFCDARCRCECHGNKSNEHAIAQVLEETLV